MKSQPAKRTQKDEKRGKQSSSKSKPRKWDEMNRAQRREMMRKMQSEDLNLEVVHPQAAGIGQRIPLCSSTAEPRPATGTMLWLHDRRTEEAGGVADPVRHSHGRAAIYGSVLDRGLRHFGRSGSGNVSSERARDQESAGAEDRRAGEPVVDEAAHLRLIAKFVSPVAIFALCEHTGGSATIWSAASVVIYSGCRRR